MLPSCCTGEEEAVCGGDTDAWNGDVLPCCECNGDCCVTTLLSKARGLRSRTTSTASRRSFSCAVLLQQPRQLQLTQYMPDAKHSQYSFKHLLFLQWHDLPTRPVGSCGASDGDMAAALPLM